MIDATFRQQLLDALRTDAEVRQAVVEIVAVELMSGVGWAEHAARQALALAIKQKTLEAVADACARGGSFPARMGL